MEKMFDLLVDCPLFRGISSTEIEQLLKNNVYQLKHYRKGDLVAVHDDEITALQIVLMGSVKGEMPDLSGKVIKIEDIEAPRPLAVAFLFGQQNRFPVDLVANDEVKILRIAKPDVLLLFQQNRRFLTNYLNAISNRTQFLTRKLFFLSFRTIREKIAFYLAEQMKLQNSSVIILSQPQREMAELFGVARPSLARGFAELEDEGFIEVDRREIKILNKEGLISIAGR
ncbi:MAG: Crp/Fnr family transcriptional regulator [Bacteroidota bacterium]|nr:Crp/Fnr family transcriptional regulator [Bacteroidota bacterium]